MQEQGNFILNVYGNVRVPVIFTVIELAKYWSQCYSVNNEMKDIIEDFPSLELRIL